MDDNEAKIIAHGPTSNMAYPVLLPLIFGAKIWKYFILLSQRRGLELLCLGNFALFVSQEMAQVGRSADILSDGPFYL